MNDFIPFELGLKMPEISDPTAAASAKKIAAITKDRDKNTGLQTPDGFQT